jgi:hypothetical protein
LSVAGLSDRSCRWIGSIENAGAHQNATIRQGDVGDISMIVSEKLTHVHRAGRESIHRLSAG